MRLGEMLSRSEDLYREANFSLSKHHGILTVPGGSAFTPKMWEQNGNNKRQAPPKTVLHDIGKG
jgi:hypothetical protein